MKAIKYISSSDIIIIVSKVYFASSFLQRFLGLLAIRPLKDSEGLLIRNCNSIHTMFMKYSIDVVFIDINDRVVAVIKDLHPFRFSPYIRKAFSVLELKAGTADKASIKIGDLIDFME